jgi:hypothetical protein
MPAVDSPEVSLALAEDHGHDIHRDLIDEAEGECLAADVAGTDCHDTVVGAPLRLRHRSGDVVEEGYVGFGVPALGLGSVRYDKEVLTGGRLSLPAVGQVEQVSPLDSRPDAVPGRSMIG